MMLGAVTYNVLKDWDLETVITKLEQAGFEAVELRTGHAHGVEPTLSLQERARVRARFEKSRVRLLSFGSTCEYHSPDPNVCRKNIEETKMWIDLAHDTGAWGVKVRPNALPKDVPPEVTIGRIAEALREAGDYAAGRGVEIWMEVHGSGTSAPPVCAAIMRGANHRSAGLCWNSNPGDVQNGSVRSSFELLRPWIRNVHINELADPRYPWRELFTLLRQSGYERYTLMEVASSCEPERFLRYYSALWKELTRP